VGIEYLVMVSHFVMLSLSQYPGREQPLYMSGMLTSKKLRSDKRRSSLEDKKSIRATEKFSMSVINK
jgi:hypothetical protein